MFPDVIPSGIQLIEYDKLQEMTTLDFSRTYGILKFLKTLTRTGRVTLQICCLTKNNVGRDPKNNSRYSWLKILLRNYWVSLWPEIKWCVLGRRPTLFWQGRVQHYC